MVKEAWEALRAAILLDSELKRQREDILRALNIIRELAAENEALRARVARLEEAHCAVEAELRVLLLRQLQLPNSPPPVIPAPRSNGRPRTPK
jgi:seryl-tRNA synthetase